MARSAYVRTAWPLDNISGHGLTDQVHVSYRNRYGRARSYSAAYEGVLPWIERHPNMQDEGLGCPQCGTMGKLIRSGTYRAQSRMYPRYQCTKCGHYCRDTTCIRGAGASKSEVS